MHEAAAGERAVISPARKRWVSGKFSSLSRLQPAAHVSPLKGLIGCQRVVPSASALGYKTVQTGQIPDRSERGHPNRSFPDGPTHSWTIRCPHFISHSSVIHLLRGLRIAYDSSGMSKASTETPNLREKGQILSGSEIERTLVRLAHEIVEKNNGVANLGLVGIMRRGVPLAQRLAKILGRIEKTNVPVGTLDITLYRDDLSTVGHRPEVKKSKMEFDIQGKDIVLVDDVIYTGRTARAALDALFDHGRPRRIQLCALIDRGHRELPIEASFIGRTIQTTVNQSIEVKLSESDGADKVLMMERVPEAR